MRVFLAISIDESSRRKLGEVVHGFKNMSLPVKWVLPENMHVTVKFLGEVDESKLTEVRNAADEICRKNTEFSMNLKGFGCFPRPNNPRVIWVGVEQGALEICNLVVTIEGAMGALGFKPEDRYHPHVTVGRTRRPCAIGKILETEFQSDVFPVRSVLLFESTLTPSGPIYRVIENYNLIPA